MLTLNQCPFHPHFTAVARKRPRSFSKTADGRLHLNMHTPLTQRNRSGLIMPLSRHSVKAFQEMISHATRQETLSHSRLSSLSHWTNPGVQSEISVRKLISTFKKKKSQTLFKNSSHTKRKKPPPMFHHSSSSSHHCVHCGSITGLG